MNENSESCSYFLHATCRSCSILNLPYEQQIALKVEKLRTLFGAEAPIADFEKCEPQFYTRAKAKMAVAPNPGGPLIGFTDSTWKTTDIIDCPLLDPIITKILHAAKSELLAHQVPAYDIALRTGEVKFLLLKVNRDRTEAILRFVANSEQFLEVFKEIASNLTKTIPELRVVSLNLQPEPKAVIEGDTEIILSETTFINENMGQTKLRYSPKSFAQVTPVIAEKLYAYVAQIIATEKVSSLWDLYCGVGAFSLCAAAHVKQILGIEITYDAIENATASAKVNQINHARYQVAEVGEFLESSKAPAPDAIIVNPPRRGLGRQICDRLLKLEPRILVYSSCNADTLKRDVEFLQAKYRLEGLQGFDMFPLTEHFETVALLKIRGR